MERIHNSSQPLVGGNYSGVYNPATGTWQQGPVHQPTWRTSNAGTAVGWIDPATAVTVPPVHPAGIGAGS